jgi:hypothetical protein
MLLQKSRFLETEATLADDDGIQELDLQNLRGRRDTLGEFSVSGFECPSIPDIQAGQTHWNFTMIARDGTMRLMQVVYTGGRYQIQPTSAPPDQVVYSPFEDFSCYVKIYNNSPTDLVLQTSGVSSGFSATKPPARIPADQTGEFWIEDFTGPAGSAGNATYISGGKPLAFSFSCPTISWNTASGGAVLLASSKNPPLPDGSYNHVPGGDHPLFVKFFIQNRALREPRCDDLTAGADWSPAASGNPAGYARSDGTNSVLYRGENNHIYELIL